MILPRIAMQDRERPGVGQQQSTLAVEIQLGSLLNRSIANAFALQM
jgi:hypothetical protein